MPITLNHSNISVQYSTGSNYIIETVKSDLYVRDSRVGISSNLTGEPSVSPLVSSTEYIYPPYRYFTYNNSTGAYTVQNGSMEQGQSTSFTYNYTFNDTANTVGNNLQTTSTVKNIHGMGEYTFSIGGTQTADGRSSGIFIYGLTSDYDNSTRGNRPGVNFDDNAALPAGAGWYVGSGWTNNKTTYPSADYYNTSMPGAWIKVLMPREIVFSSFEILGGPQYGRSPKDFKIYGSNNNTTIFSDWTLLHTQTNYTYSAGGNKGAKINVSNTLSFKNYLMIISAGHNTITGDLVVFQGWYIYGKEVLKGVLEGSLYKRLNFVIPNTYTLTFPVQTLVDVNNNSNLILQGNYNVNVGSTTSSLVPDVLNINNKLIPLPNTSTSSIYVRYHLLNPIKTVEGAQWTYSSNNTNVYHMGSVGIGTTTPEYSLDVRGNIYSSSGGYTQSGLTTWTVMSDKRIKENIVKASYEKCLENVKNIELYNFNFKDNYVNTNDRRQLGFIAQEVQQVYPKAVEVGKMILNLEEKIDDLLSLNTTQIEYTLYGAVKKLIDNIEEMENEIAEIENTSNITIQA